MAEKIDDDDDEFKNHKIKPRKTSSCFLSCFGLSETDQQYLPEVISSDDRKKVSWFSSTRFRRKKSVRRTVPVDNPFIGGKTEVKSEQIRDVKKADHDDKVIVTITTNRKCQIPASEDRKVDRIREIEEVVSDRNGNKKIQKAKCENAQDNISEPRKLKANMYQKQLSLGGRTKEAKDGSHPGSPINKSSTRTTISHSKSFPLPGRSKSGESSHSVKQAQHVGQKSSRENGHSQLVGQKSGELSSVKFGPVMGMSVLVVLLGMMLLWGRVCAVVFTSAWIYFIRYFRSVLESSEETIEKTSKFYDDRYFDSKEYKKKVILEGLLDRKH